MHLKLLAVLDCRTQICSVILSLSPRQSCSVSLCEGGKHTPSKRQTYIFCVFSSMLSLFIFSICSFILNLLKCSSLQYFVFSSPFLLLSDVTKPGSFQGLKWGTQFTHFNVKGSFFCFTCISTIIVSVMFNLTDHEPS